MPSNWSTWCHKLKWENINSLRTAKLYCNKKEQYLIITSTGWKFILFSSRFSVFSKLKSTLKWCYMFLFHYHCFHSTNFFSLSLRIFLGISQKSRTQCIPFKIKKSLKCIRKSPPFSAHFLCTTIAKVLLKEYNWFYASFLLRIYILSGLPLLCSVQNFSFW